MKKIYISKTRTLDVNIAKELIKDLKIIDAKSMEIQLYSF